MPLDKTGFDILCKLSRRYISNLLLWCVNNRDGPRTGSNDRNGHIFCCIVFTFPLSKVNETFKEACENVFFMLLLPIMKTCLYSFDPLKPHFYIVKLGFTGVYIIFLISAQNIDYGYSLELPR